MGRWAQQRRRGGGGQPPPSLAHLVDGLIDVVQPSMVHFTYSAPVSGLLPGNFAVPVDTAFGQILTTVDATHIDVLFDNDVFDGHTAEYTGSTPGVLTPDSIVLHS